MNYDPNGLGPWLNSLALDHRQQFWVDLLFQQNADDLAFVAKTVSRLQSYQRAKAGEVPNQAVMDQVLQHPLCHADSNPSMMDA